MNAPDPNELEKVLYWIREREAVRKAKEAGAPKPWSKDPLFTSYRWCNVKRMDDRVSVDLMRYWYEDASPQTQLVAATLARLVNWPEAMLEATGGERFRITHLASIRLALKARAQRGMKCFTGAYLVPGVPGMNKVDSVLDLVERVHAGAAEIFAPTLRQTWQHLIQLDGLGSFLAGQIVADIAQISGGRLWPDRFSWAPVGPGSARGINRLFGRPKTKPVSQTQFDEELAHYIGIARPQVLDIAEDRQLCVADWQSTMCEFDKLRRLQLGEGTVRARYDGAPVVQGSLL